MTKETKVKLVKPVLHCIKVTKPCLYSRDSLTGAPSRPVDTPYIICIRNSGICVTKH